MNNQKKIIVIGGGAAGIMAAGQAALSGCSTILLEKMSRPGRKLCITGKGRCNITNSAPISKFFSHFGSTRDFLMPALNSYTNDELIDFFETNGLKTIKERGGRIFPVNGSAPAVVATLLNWAKKNGVQIVNQTRVEKLIITNNRVEGVIANNKAYYSDAVILATGGASYPVTGSTGDGYKLAESAGHTIITPRPALVPLETTNDIAGKMTDLNLRNINATLLVNNQQVSTAFGELTFTKHGVSGPVILTLSGIVVDALKAKKDVEVILDLKPALNEAKLNARLQRDFTARAKEPLFSILRGLLPKQLIPICISQTKIAGRTLGKNINRKQQETLYNWLKNFRIKITGHRPFAEAIITAGGVCTDEVDPHTMESKKTHGLYIIGELLDIQADTGGYNLQAAFSTAHLAAADL